MFTVQRCKFAYTMNTYGERLQSAMQEAGFGGPGGQTKLANEIGARSQTINQALKGGSKELTATFHVRACLRLGIRPLWLSEGRGPRYERSGPVHGVIGGADASLFQETNVVQLLPPATGVVQDGVVPYGDEDQRLMNKLRRRSPAFQAAVAQLIDLADSGQT